MLFALEPHERALFFPDGFSDFAETETLEASVASSSQFHWKPESLTTTGGWLALLQEVQPHVIVSCWSTPAIPPAFLQENQSLRYICHLVGSVRNLVPRSFLEQGGALTNWGALAGKTVAEHALLLALSALRNQPRWRSVIEDPRVNPWRSGTMRLQTRSLFGQRVGIHGFGHVGRALIALLKPFDVEISVYSSGVPAALLRAADIMPCDSLNELAAHSDVFFECEALTPFNHGCIDAGVLAQLPDSAVFVNVARGALVNESDLIAEAESGRITVALDVVAKEPIDPDSPLNKLPGAVLSPHIGGPTHDHFPACGQHALANLARFLRDEKLEASITPELYDRST